MNEQLVLRCEDSINGIFTALYDAFVYKNQMKEPYEDDITISVGEGDTMRLFAREVEVKTEDRKVAKTVYAISNKLGYSVYDTVFRALCHYDRERATVVLGYLVRAFSKGSRIKECLADPFVMRVMELSRKVYNEYDKFSGFLRFRDVGRGLVAEFAPKCDLLPLLVDHFSDRMPGENFLIYDRNRKYALIHPANQSCFFVSGEMAEKALQGKERNRAEEGNAFTDRALCERDAFEALWKRYFDTMAIRERTNERYQNTTVPKWYRKDMLEFESKSF